MINNKTYYYIANSFIGLGAIGVGVGVFGLLANKNIHSVIGIIGYAFGFSVFGWIFSKISIIALEISEEKQLTKSEEEWIRYLAFFRFLAVSLIIMGILGTGVGIYSTLFRAKSLFDQVWISFFFFYAVNFSVWGRVLYKKCVALER